MASTVPACCWSVTRTPAAGLQLLLPVRTTGLDRSSPAQAEFADRGFPVAGVETVSFDSGTRIAGQRDSRPPAPAESPRALSQPAPLPQPKETVH